MGRSPLRCSAVFVATLLAACGGGSSTPPPPNQAPLAWPIGVTVAQDRTVTFTVLGTDADQDPLTYQAATQPAHGTLSGMAPVWTYTPTASYFGQDRFTFTVSDGKAASPPADVSLNVLPVRGAVVPGGAALDDRFVNVLHILGMRGGLAAAIAKDGKLVYARGFGYADSSTQEPFLPDALSRIASNSKMLTMAAVLHLVDEGVLGLEDKLLDRLPALASTVPLDSRLADITLRQVLGHTSGLPPNDDADPMSQYGAVSADLGVAYPPPCAEIFRWSVGHRRLWFTPGAGFAYSNLGFCALALVVEQVAGQDYQSHVRDVVLAPMGIHDMRFGGSHLADRAPGEVVYSSPWTWPSAFPGDAELVPRHYGGISIPSGSGAGAWIGSAIDLTRFLNGLDGRGGQAAFLSVSSWTAATTEQFSGSGYGLGIGVGEAHGTRWLEHVGYIPGSYTWSVRSDSGWTFSFLLNSEPEPLVGDIWGGLVAVVVDIATTGGFTGSPTDLYPSFPSPKLGPYTGD